MSKFVLNKGKLGVANKGDTALQAFVDVYIKGHKGGWSSFPDECYCHSPEFVMRDGARDEMMTDKTADPLFIEWVYVIDVENKKMLIYVGGRAKGKHIEKSLPDKDTGEVRSWKSENYKHYLVCELDINPDVPEPNWEFVEATGSKISNEMYKKFDKEVKHARG